MDRQTDRQTDRQPGIRHMGSYRRPPLLSRRETGTGWHYTFVECVVLQKDPVTEVYHSPTILMK